MAPFDRESALKAAEKALKLGKVEAAIVQQVFTADGEVWLSWVEDDTVRWRPVAEGNDRP